MRYIPATRETVKAYPRSHSRSPFETMAGIPALRRKPPNHKIAQIAVPPSLSIMMFSMVQSFSPCMPQTSVPRNFFAAIRRPDVNLVISPAMWVPTGPRLDAFRELMAALPPMSAN